jgi:hypothetical protein
MRLSKSLLLLMLVLMQMRQKLAQLRQREQQILGSSCSCIAFLFFLACVPGQGG